MMMNDLSLWNKEVPNDTAITMYNGAIRVELNRTDPMVNGSKRAEIAMNPETPNEEHTYCFSTFLPTFDTEDFKLDPTGSEIIAQWHNVPDENEEWTSPPLCLKTYNGVYLLGRVWDSAPITDMQKANFEGLNLGSYLQDKGRWARWKFHIKWGWSKSQNPILEIYKDDILIVSRVGIGNTTNDKTGVYMKLGIYKWDWAQGENDMSQVDKRVIYYKDISVV